VYYKERKENIMKTFDYTITDPQGIHARPAGMLVKEAAKYQSSITIEKEGKKGDAKKIFAVMGLGVKAGQTITVTVEGEDEAAASEAIEKFLKETL
jgi:phosphocarrier protein HPr